MTNRFTMPSSSQCDPAMGASRVAALVATAALMRRGFARRRCSPSATGAASRASDRGRGPARRGRADHGDRVDQEPEGDLLRRRRLDPACAGVDRDEGTRDAGRGLQRRGEEGGPSLEPLRRCLDAAHAAHHLERHRAARRAVARICRLARLHTNAVRLCREAVRQGPHGHARDHLAERRGAGRVFPSGAVGPETRGHRGGSEARRNARPRGGRGRQAGATGEERCRAGGEGGGPARGGAAQA